MSYRVMGTRIREATPADADAMFALLPRLAAFEIPDRREPEDLWRGDAELQRAWLDGRDDTGVVCVAVDERDRVRGVAVARLRPELLSSQPSAHLEVLVVGDGAEGRGVGRALMASIEAAVRRRGARSLTLHVFASNARARRLYDALGFSGELVRYIKDLE